MAYEQTYQFLRAVPLFAELPQEDLDRICEMVQDVRLEPGEVLFEEGEEGDRAYIIRSGELEIVKASGRRQVLVAVRGRGDVIGEMALLEDRARSATVRARTASDLYGVAREPFLDLVQNSASAARARCSAPS